MEAIIDFVNHYIFKRHKGTTENWATDSGWTIVAFCCWDCGRITFEKTYPTFK